MAACVGRTRCVTRRDLQVSFCLVDTGSWKEARDVRFYQVSRRRVVVGVRRESHGESARTMPRPLASLDWNIDEPEPELQHDEDGGERVE